MKNEIEKIRNQLDKIDLKINRQIRELNDKIRDLESKPRFIGKGLEMVTFDRCENPFQIAKYLVTQQLWEEVMGSNPWSFKYTANLPVENVSWIDVREFILKLNELTGKTYRLPTEYEWMLAATVDNTIYSGSDNIDEVAWYSENSDDKTHPVGQLKPNSLGLYDMTGNVWEWCSTLYEKGKPYRVLRGGAWNDDAQSCRCTFRNDSTPGYRSDDFGFRLVLPL